MERYKILISTNLATSNIFDSLEYHRNHRDLIIILRIIAHTPSTLMHNGTELDLTELNLPLLLRHEDSVHHVLLLVALLGFQRRIF
jgi:hypothetical protein